MQAVLNRRTAKEGVFMSQLKNVRVLTFTGMLIALAAVLSFFSIPITSIIEIRFKFIALAFAGALFGPFIGGVVGGAADIIGYLIKPTGPFMPGFTLTAVVAGVLYGLLLYKKPVTLKRIVVVSLIVTLVTGTFLNTVNLSIGYGLPFVPTLIARIPSECIMYPINTAMLWISMKALEQVRRHTAQTVAQ